MRTGYSAQYDKPALIVEDEDGDDLTVQELMDRCREIGAIYYEDGPEDECFVVTLRPDVGPELWTPSALTRSIVARKLKETKPSTSEPKFETRAEVDSYIVGYVCGYLNIEEGLDWQPSDEEASRRLRALREGLWLILARYHPDLLPPLDLASFKEKG